MTDAGLHGRLADFTLEEILQLIALQQKTGLLVVDASYPMVLAFESGMLIGYRDQRRNGRDPLETYLKNYGFFQNESWEHIDFVQRHSKLDLTEILVNESLVDAEELASLQMEAAQEDIFRGMQLRDGRYQFLPGRDAFAGLKGRVRFKVDGLLMEAVRRIDEIGGLRERFASDDLKLRANVTDATDRSAAERRLLALLVKEQSLGRLVAQGRMSEFETLSTLEQLVQEGLVTVQSPSRPATEDVKEVVGQLRRDRGLGRPVAISLLTLVACSVIALWQPWAPYSYREGGPAGAAYELELARDRARVEAAVQLFEQAHGRLPRSLAELAAGTWSDEATLARVRERYELRVQDTAWSLAELSAVNGR